MHALGRGGAGGTAIWPMAGVYGDCGSCWVHDVRVQASHSRRSRQEHDARRAACWSRVLLACHVAGPGLEKGQAPCVPAGASSATSPHQHSRLAQVITRKLQPVHLDGLTC